MTTLAVMAVLFGLFTELRTPAKGYECLQVRHQNFHYLALKLERARMTGRVTLTMRRELTFEEKLAPLIHHPDPAPSPNIEGRRIELSGSDMVTDSTDCDCSGWSHCVDR